MAAPAYAASEHVASMHTTTKKRKSLPKDPLTVIGAGAAARTVKLAGQPDGTFTGTASIPLSNSSQTRVNAAVSYYGQQPSDSVRIGLTRPVSVPPGRSAVLNFTAVVKSPGVPSDLNGTLVITERDTKHHTLGTLAFAVQGTLLIPTDVTFEPSDITLQVTLRQWFSDTPAGETQTVRLRGAGVAQLVHTLNALALKGDASTLLLADGEGQETLVQLAPPVLKGPGLAEVKLCVQGAEHCGTNAPSPGTYTGTLSLAPGESDAPTFKVTVNTRFWLLVPILLVFGGALIGGLLPLLSANSRTKAKLRGALRTSLAAYSKVRPAEPDTQSAWDIASLLGPEDSWYALQPGATGVVAPLWASIRSSTSDDDFKQDGAAVADLTAQLDAWTQAEPLATELVTLRDHPPKDRTGHPWNDTQVRNDTAILLDQVQTPPIPDAKSASEFVRRLRAQLRFHQAYVRAWELRDALDQVKVSAAEQQPDAATWDTANLDKFNAQVAADPEAGRAPATQSTLNLQLNDVTVAIERLLAAHRPQQAPTGPSVALTAEQRTEVADQLFDEQLAPKQVADRVGVGVQAVRAVSDELAPVIAANAPPVATRSIPGGRALRALHDAFDLSLTFAIGAGAAAAYVLPLYTSSWGSAQDMAAAVAAGVAGQAVVNWAVLPALRSRRLPAAAANE